jgi:hypothetical protein
MYTPYLILFGLLLALLPSSWLVYALIANHPRLRKLPSPAVSASVTQLMWRLITLMIVSVIAFAVEYFLWVR